MAETVTSLTDSILQQLQHETFVILNTIDHETGRITSNAISWITALSHQCIRIAVDQRSRLITNMKENKQVTLSLFAAGSF